KVISNRMQYEGLKFEVFHANQLGGIHQRSTEDAGLILTHLIKAGWAKGLRTSVVAFDIVQFFPSLNHNMMIEILRRQGFAPELVNFFASYLVGRFTAYRWNDFLSDLMAASLGVRQGSAMSPILSALYLAPVMKIFFTCAPNLEVDLLSYVDDGTIIAQGKTWDDTSARLRRAYHILHDLFGSFGLVVEHSKSEVFHFSRKHG